MSLELGTVVATAGTLLIIDAGYVRLWTHDREPVMPAGVLPDDATEAANGSVDLAFVGVDALAMGKRVGVQWDPRFVFDVPADDLELLHERVKRAAAKHGLDARAEVLERRVPHRERVDLALAHGNGAGEVLLHGIWASAIGNVPAGPLRVVAEPMPAGHPCEARWRRVAIVASTRPVARSERVGLVAVDYARLLVVDVDAAGAWKNEAPAEGAAAVVDVAGTRACHFPTTWGDGLFDVHRDLDDDGGLVQIRIEMGTDERCAQLED